MIDYKIAKIEENIHQITISGDATLANEEEQLSSKCYELIIELNNRFIRGKNILPFLIFDVTQLQFDYTKDISHALVLFLLQAKEMDAIIISTKVFIKAIYLYARNYYYRKNKFGLIVVNVFSQALKKAAMLKKKRKPPFQSDEVLLHAKIPLLLLCSLLVRLRSNLWNKNKIFKLVFKESRYFISQLEKENFINLENLILNNDKVLKSIFDIFSLYSDDATEVQLFKEGKIRNNLMGSVKLAGNCFAPDFVLKEKYRFYFPLIVKMMETADRSVAANDFEKAARYIDAVHFLPETLVGNRLVEKYYWEWAINVFIDVLSTNDLIEIKKYLKTNRIPFYKKIKESIY
jgi:hypothetical protein